MIKAKHLLNIYISLYNYRKILKEKGLKEDENEIKNTLDFLLDQDIEIITNTPIKLRGQI